MLLKRTIISRVLCAIIAIMLAAAWIIIETSMAESAQAAMYFPFPSYSTELSAVCQDSSTPVIPTIVSTLNFGRFSDRALYIYRIAASKDIPWYMMAAIDLVEQGSCAAPTLARLNTMKARLIGSTVDAKLRNYGGGGSFIMMVKRRMNDLLRIDAMFGKTYRFPLPLWSGYTYEDTWGSARTFGGERFHEGIDLIVAEGTPIYSASYGTVTKKGWLTLGGWRIGVQDSNGIYYYYAHLSSYGQYEVGDTVRPGDILGYVGSTGYGPEGTSDVMIPHLHFGMYENDAAFNPYAFLKAWR